MGKTHNVQRTKGNTRPSNSSHTASLLFSSGNGLCPLNSSMVPLQQLLDDIAAVDPDISLCFKKMIKRDSITKMKAVQEFAELCKEKDEHALQSVLPVWTRLYNRLCLEPDHRVREATHTAQESLVLRVGRGIAPHLKSIMAAWLVSQCDSYLQAASLAQASFRAAFSPDKQAEALAYCKKDIFNFLEGNLLDSGLQSAACDATNPEAFRSLQLVLCSLNGLCLFLSKVPELPPNLLPDPKFWKLAKSKNNQIRASWYRLVAHICQVLPQLANEYAERIVPATLSHLSEPDAMVVPALWEAVLYALTTVEDCWKHVNCEKTVLPQLWSLLKEGGHGNAPLIFPNLLPLLANLPPAMLEPTFFRTFFSHFTTGLTKVQGDQIESLNILTSYLECIRWAIKMDPNLLMDKFQPWLHSILSDPESQLCSDNHLLQVQEFFCEVDREELWEELGSLCREFFHLGCQHPSVHTVRERISRLLCGASANPQLRQLALRVCLQHLPLLQQDPEQYLATLASLVKMAPSAEFFAQLCTPPTDLYWVHLKPACASVPAAEIALELLVALPDLDDALSIFLEISKGKHGPLILGLLLEGLVVRRQELVQRWLEDFAAVQATLVQLSQPANLDFLEPILLAVGSPLATALISTLLSPPGCEDLLHHCRLLSASAPHCQDSQLKAPFMELFSLACRALEQEDQHVALEECLHKCWGLLQDKEDCLQEMATSVHGTLMTDLRLEGLKPLVQICRFVLEHLAVSAELAQHFVSHMFPTIEEWELLYIGIDPQKLCPDWEPQESFGTRLDELTMAASPLLVAAFCSSILLSPAALTNPAILTSALPCIFCIHFNSQQEEGDLTELLTSNITQLRTSHSQDIISGLFSWSKQKGFLASLTLKRELSLAPQDRLEGLLGAEGLEKSQHTLQVLVELGACSHLLRPTLLRFLEMVPPDGRPELCLLSSILSHLPLDKMREDVGFFTCHLQDLLKQHPQAFLNLESVGEASQELLLWNCRLARVMEACLRCPRALTKTSWEKLLCVLGDWVTAADRAAPLLVASSFSLVAAVHRAMELGQAEGPWELGVVKVEWEEFFSPLIHKVLLGRLLSAADGTQTQDVLHALSLAVIGVPASKLSQDMSGQLVPLLQFPMRPVKMASFNILLGLIPSLTQEQQPAEVDGPEEEEQDLAKKLLPDGLTELMEELGSAVQEIVEPWPLGNSALLKEPNALSTVTSYLLSWNLALRTLSALNPLMRYQVANSLSDSGLLDIFLKNLFHLMPHKINKTWFRQVPSYSPEPRCCSVPEVQHLSCYLYYETLSNLPAAVRRWFNNLDRKDRDLVDKFTTTWVSGIVISREIGISNYSSENLAVKFRPSIRAVTAAYTIEEVTTELEITLPLNHPLGPLTIETNQRIKVRAQQWKVWLRQLNTFLIQQNGSILEGLVLWKKNIDKAFLGMEECTVCYQILHGSTGLLPKLKCRVCHKNFHSTCLFKWFRTSNSAKCPHCRGLFW